MDNNECEPRKNPWWFHPKLYVIVLWTTLIISVLYPSIRLGEKRGPIDLVISGFFWIWIAYGITVGVIGIRNMARRRRLANSG